MIASIKSPAIKACGDMPEPMVIRAITVATNERTGKRKPVIEVVLGHENSRKVNGRAA